jgi:ornithine cyclodeaminase/alanine dehydrogenase-like protein (mu-crystallin family)
MLILNNNDVRAVLDMNVCLDALDGVYQELLVGEAVSMGRIDLYVPSLRTENPYYRWSVMTGGSRKERLVCTRMMSDVVAWNRSYGHVREDKYAREPGTYCGFMLLFSAEDGQPIAMINDGVLQHFRVGSSAGLGVKYLSRASSTTLGMIGSGGMARTYLDAICAVRAIEHVKVFSPNAHNVRIYAEEMRKMHRLDVEIVDSAREAVRDVDIAATCTSTAEPIFFNKWLEPGMHFTNVTSSEIEGTLSDAVDVAIRAGALTERLAEMQPHHTNGRSGFLGYVAGNEKERALIPNLELPEKIVSMPSLADMLAGRVKGRTKDDQVSFFLNAGEIGAQFVALAASVYRRARERGLGTEFPTEYFLEDIRD